MLVFLSGLLFFAFIWSGQGASCEQIQNQVQAARGAKVRCELQAKIKINDIFAKCLCGDSYNDNLKVKRRVVSKGVGGVTSH